MSQVSNPGAILDTWMLSKERMLLLALAWGLIGVISTQAQITEILDGTGDGTSNFDNAQGVTVSGSTIYIAGQNSDNVFKIAADGTIEEVVDATGNGSGNALDAPTDVEVDGAGNVYVAGSSSDNVLKITPGGTVTQIIGPTGDGLGNTLNAPRKLAIDGSGSIYVVGSSSDNVFKITSGGTISEIIDATGDGLGNTLDNPRSVAVDGSGSIYVSGGTTDNAFKITSGGAIGEIIDATGAGGGMALNFASDIAVDNSGNVFLASASNDNAFKITPAGVVTEILNSAGDGSGNTLDNPRGVSVDASGNVYVAGANSDNCFKVEPDGTITEIADATGDGMTNALDAPRSVAVSGNTVYLPGASSDNLFRVVLAPLPVELVSFRGAAAEAAVVLTWQTSNELNSSYFTVERSADGINFASIGRQAAAGNSNDKRSYTYLDTSPEKGVAYYRLRTIDADGTFEFSNTISVAMHEMEDGLQVLFPNPSRTGEVWMQYSSPVDQELTLSVFALSGKALATVRRRVVSGESTLNLNLGSLAVGIYLVKVETESGQSSLHRVVLEGN